MDDSLGEEVIRAAIESDVDYFVYASVIGAGAEKSTLPQDVLSKALIEEFLRQKFPHSGYTIVRSACFMENFVQAR
jgi:hypothetical protein